MNPMEWLNGLRQRPQGYRSLLDEAGSFAAAAWRIAQARCRSCELSTDIPTRSELRAAAYELVQRLGGDTGLPTATSLRTECEALGLMVL